MEEIIVSPSHVLVCSLAQCQSQFLVSRLSTFSPAVYCCVCLLCQILPCSDILASTIPNYLASPRTLVLLIEWHVSLKQCVRVCNGLRCTFSVI